jgi:transcriptional regulator of acetoin/glycerol metabolism
MTQALVVRDIRESWERSSLAGVSPTLAAAPLVLNEDALFTAREQNDWLCLAEAVLTPQLELVQGSGHVLTLFDTRGHMLCSAGDPFVLEQLDDIHFIPGSDWSEGSAGTNGPGTALATRRAVHVVGREHFCEAWSPWHCAAVPLHDPAGDLLGALDISGPSQRADVKVLQLAKTLGLTVEQALQARQWKRRSLVLARFAELASRYAGEPMLAVDAEGLVFQATSAAQARGVPVRLKLPRGVSGLGAPPPQATWLEGATVFPVHEGSARIGAVLLARQSARPGSSQIGRAHV